MDELNTKVRRFDQFANKITFKPGGSGKKRVQANLSKELLHRQMVKRTQKDAMESVKKQSDKFTFSSYNATSKEATERLLANPTTFENTALHSAASKHSLLLHNTQST